MEMVTSARFRYGAPLVPWTEGLYVWRCQCTRHCSMMCSEGSNNKMCWWSLSSQIEDGSKCGVLLKQGAGCLFSLDTTSPVMLMLRHN